MRECWWSQNVSCSEMVRIQGLSVSKHLHCKNITVMSWVRYKRSDIRWKTHAISLFRACIHQRTRSTRPTKEGVFVGRVDREGWTEMKRFDRQRMSLIGITSLSCPYCCHLATELQLTRPESLMPLVFFFLRAPWAVRLSWSVKHDASEVSSSVITTLKKQSVTKAQVDPGMSWAIVHWKE